ncbi:hypothetical protein [Persephonella sp.]
MAIGKVGSGNQVMNMYMYQNQQGKKNGMGAIMQQLNPDQRQQVRDSLQSLSETDRANIVNQIKQIDYTSMSQEELYNSIMSIITNYTASTAAASSSIDIMA